MEAKVVHCKKEPYDIYIGRACHGLEGSMWENPFVIGKDGTREEVILRYELYLNTRRDLLLLLPELKGKTLGCWCKPDNDCHGDVLAKLAESKYIRNWFSNMLPINTPFIYQGIAYNTSENFYQAMKLPKDDLKNRAYIASLDPYRAKREIKNFDYRENWKEEKLKVMEYILRVKFKPGTLWYNKLKMTKNWIITEWNNWSDTFWGVDIKSGIGENHLGKILMNIRKETVNAY